MIDQPRLRSTFWSQVRGICFDLGGTLVRTEAEPTTGQVAHVLGISLEEARAVMEQEAKRRRITPEGLAGDLAAVFGRPGLVDPLVRVLEHAKQRAADPRLFPDAAPTLTVLRQRGFALFALTNSLGSSVPAEPPAAFRNLLDRVVYSAETGAIKPEREAFAAVEHVSGLSPGQLLHVGDSLRADVTGAAAAGWHTAWLDRRMAGGPLLSSGRTVRLHTLTTLSLLLPAGPTPAPSMNSEAH
ncbi:HAD family hydrolase [Streptomyces natalensis]|uniref:Hydrolase n=1 Tax=Streptomyces natalensis ATCC 27448 TaxID=1240678 RepID=A0A0D7CH56_9ACTN|nr:HAD family hydrolase [Streptomyces natalensis]KIZ15376.1 hydrolase [Streptomyces natalensis ATCC 27448]